jgi:hypothetical protein
MAAVTHQTIKLGKGKHGSPEDGACVMELASMLAGEPFSDRPWSVCPVIGSFLRAYNDAVDDRRRQDLYAYASSVVGSRASVDVEQVRAERLAAWALELGQRRWTRFLLRSRLRLLACNPQADVVGSSAVRAIAKHNDQTHAQVLALIDELVTIGAGQQSSPALSGGRIRSAQLTR